MTLAMQLLQRLAEARAGESASPCFVSGAALATEFAVTRSAVWKAMGVLRERGTEIQAITHRGYRLVQPSSPLSADGVSARLSPEVRAQLREGRCLTETASTNSALMERGAPPPGHFDYLTAEYQSAGRGRLGRSWLAPPGGAICMSWSWYFEGIGQPGALSLATGVAVLRALTSLGVTGVRLKWPNDLVTAEGKLGGILIEMRSEAAGPLHVVVGLGLNVTLGSAMREFINAAGGNRATDLAMLCAGGVPPAREALVAALLEHNVALLRGFAREGFSAARAEYLAADALLGRPVRVIGGGAAVPAGIARGVDADGALLVEHEGRIHSVVAGEVSVRPDEDA